jgi:CelD/BcsL family acetyltransferase involved in cellulose biosynthesis
MNVCIERITTLAGFDAERQRWEHLERSDPHASMFTSWRWLRAYLATARYRWSILVARDGPDAIAYLPIAYIGSALYRELRLGGNPLADYTGMVASPAHEELAIAAFCGELEREPWNAFNASDVSDPRIDVIVDRLTRANARVESQAETRCLSCALPTTFDEYLTQCISAKTRVNSMRVERRLAEALDGFRISEASAADIGVHVEAMIVVNHKRWGGSMTSARRRFGTLFRNAFDTGILRLVVYWDGDKPIAGAAAFVDDTRSSFGLYMIGFDSAYDKWSPGKGIITRAIRMAIEGGYRRFDFLRGDEPFKTRYARDVHVTRHYRLTRPGILSAAVALARPPFFAVKLAVATLIYGPGRTL